MREKAARRGRAGVARQTRQEPASEAVVSADTGGDVVSGRQDAPQEWALLDQVLDGSPIGIVVLDRELRFLRLNTRAEAMFGVDEHKHAGRRVESVLPLMFAEIKLILADIIHGGAPHLAIETAAPKIGPATAPRLYLAYYYPLVAGGSVIGVGCMFIDITEQRAAEGALLDSEEGQRTILDHMLRAQEDERARLALELHDDTIQVLCALLLQLDGMIALANRPSHQEEMAGRLETSREVLSAATARARKLMFSLHPTVLHEQGLRAAITAFAEEIGTEMNAEWSVAIPDARYAWTLEELAYRIVREALTNIRKHSHADRFSVTIVEKTGSLAGVVQDDGQGLASSDDTSHGDHLGVEGMKQRARLAGGDLTITSTKRQGVRVAFSLPAGEHK